MTLSRFFAIAVPLFGAWVQLHGQQVQSDQLERNRIDARLIASIQWKQQCEFKILDSRLAIYPKLCRAAARIARARHARAVMADVRWFCQAVDGELTALADPVVLDCAMSLQESIADLTPNRRMPNQVQALAEQLSAKCRASLQNQKPDPFSNY